MVGDELNRRQTELAEAGHRPTFGRKPLGRTPIFNRPVYGTTLRCQCGAHFSSNETPSNGGRKRVLAMWEQHADKGDQ